MSHSEQLLAQYSSYVRMVERDINNVDVNMDFLAFCIEQRNKLYEDILEIMEMSEYTGFTSAGGDSR